MKRTSNIRESQTEKEQGNDYIIIDFDKHPKEETGRIVFSKEIHLSQRNTTETKQKQELIRILRTLQKEFGAEIISSSSESASQKAIEFNRRIMFSTAVIWLLDIIASYIHIMRTSIIDYSILPFITVFLSCISLFITAVIANNSVKRGKK